MTEQTQNKNKNVQNYLLSLARAKKSASRMTTKINQLVVGAPRSIKDFEMVGYMHNKRLHKTDLKLSDFHFLKYLWHEGNGFYYFIGEVCINRGRKTQQIVNKMLICKIKGDE